MPEGLDWDLWLGPAPQRPFNHAYLPFVWRGWSDFGCGALGDMGSYSFDTIFRVLKLEAPVSVEASSSDRYDETYPLASIVRYSFPARGDMPPVKFTWYDGGLKPARPEELEENRPLKGDGEEDEGLLFIGDRGENSVQLQWRQSQAHSANQDGQLQTTAKDAAQVAGQRTGVARRLQGR